MTQRFVVTPELLCGVYQDRPAICRSYQADAFCESIAAATLEGRVHNYLAAFGLLEEAARGIAQGTRSMRASRALPILGGGAGRRLP